MPFGFLVGLLFASLGLVATVAAPSYDFFNYYFTLFISVMFLFSGVFFPLENLPPVGADDRLVPSPHARRPVARALVAGTPTPALLARRGLDGGRRPRRLRRSRSASCAGGSSSDAAAPGMGIAFAWGWMRRSLADRQRPSGEVWPLRHGVVPVTLDPGDADAAADAGWPLVILTTIVLFALLDLGIDAAAFRTAYGLKLLHAPRRRAPGLALVGHRPRRAGRRSPRCSPSTGRSRSWRSATS